MKLSACMIVRDEEKCLTRCLTSIRPYVDEIVVVDTGSVDRTIEIAKDFDCVIHETEWTNDFSYHRNQAFGLATGDWMLVIDADEEMLDIEITLEEFKKRFEMLPKEINAIIVKMYETTEEGQTIYTWTSPRWFRNNVGVHYKHAVHNQAVYPGQGALTNLKMIHHAYHQDPARRAKKEARMLEMLTEEHKKDPENYRILFYMCQYNIRMQNFEEGIEYGKKCLELLPLDDPEKFQHYGNLYFTIGTTLVRMNKPDDGWAWYNKGLEFFPDCPDLNFGMAQLGFMTQRADIFMPAAKKYLEVSKEHVTEIPMNKFKNYGKMPMPTRSIFTGTNEHRSLMKQWVEIVEAEQNGK